MKRALLSLSLLAILPFAASDTKRHAAGLADYLRTHRIRPQR